MVCALVVSGQIAHADVIQLKSGDELHAKIKRVTAAAVYIDHPELGNIRLSRDKVVGDLDHAINPGLFGTSFMSGWNRRIDAGLNGSEGSSVSTNATAGLNFNYKDKDKRWLATGRYALQRNKKRITSNNAGIDIRRDWLLPDSPWFVFATGRYQYDQFQSWEHRIVLSTGPGYNLLKREKQTLDVRIGPAYTRDFSGQNPNKVEVLWAMDYSWNPWDRVKLTLSNEFYTEIWEDAGQFRNVTSAAWTTRLLDEPALSLIVGVNNEYETDLKPPSKNNNLKYHTTLGVDF